MPSSRLADQNPGAVFGCTLLDPSGQPNIVIDSTQSQQLNWTLVNNASEPGKDLVVKPFTGPVSESQYHFSFYFDPGTFTTAPTVDGWDVSVDPDDGSPITTVYLAYKGPNPLSISPGGRYSSTWIYTKAEGQTNSPVNVTVTAASSPNVTLGGNPIIRGNTLVLDLNLVPAGTPALSAAPIAVDFVGRRTVLNDGKTPNAFTFAVTNLTSEPIPVTPIPQGPSAEETTPTTFTVWFDAAPNDGGPSYPWALAQVQNLIPVQLPAPSLDWHVTRLVTAALAQETADVAAQDTAGQAQDATVEGATGAVGQVVRGNPQWRIQAQNPVTLTPQSPVLFKFSNLVTDLAPGVTRMYLRYEDLPGFADGVLIAELEKSPLLYGTARGQGLYLSAGNPGGGTPPAPNYDGGLYIDQFDPSKRAAMLSGGTGLLIQTSNDQPALSVNQAGSGPAAQLNSGAVINVGSQEQQGLAISASNDQAALSVDQTGSGPAARIQGGAALSGSLQVDGGVEVTGSDEVLAAGPALWVTKGDSVFRDLVVETGSKTTLRDTTVDGNVELNGIMTGNSWIGGQAARIRGYGTNSEAVFAFKFDNKNFGNTPSAIQIWNESAAVYKTFIIEHPLDEERYLVHATLEGPEPAVFYRGSGRLQGGRAEITLPTYFAALTDPDSVTVQLTGVDGYDRLCVQTVDGRKVHDGRVSVVSDDPTSTQAFDWEVKASRRDQPPFVVEPDKRDVAVQGFGPYVYAMPGA